MAAAGSLEELLEQRRLEIQARAFGSGAGVRGRAVAPSVPASTSALPGEVSGLPVSKGVSIVTVTRTIQDFGEIVKNSPDENVRKMYDALMAEVHRRGMKL